MLAPNLVDDLFAEFAQIWEREWPGRIAKDIEGAKYHWGRALADFEWPVIWSAIEEARNIFKFSPSFSEMRELCFKYRNEKSGVKPAYVNSSRTPISDFKSPQFYCEKGAQVIVQLKKLHYPDQKWNQQISNELIEIFNSYKIQARQDNPDPTIDNLMILKIIESTISAELKNKREEYCEQH